MSFELECILPGCAAEVRGESEEDVMRQAGDHAARDHGMEAIDATTAAKIRKAIRKR